MIPIERYAADTARMTTLAAELDGLDQVWSALNGEFGRIAKLVHEQQASGLVGGQELTRLSQLDDDLTAIEEGAVHLLIRLTSTLKQAGRG